MHTWDDDTEELAHSVVGYAVERLRNPKDPAWGAVGREALAAALDGAICPNGIGGPAALALATDVIIPSCRPMDDPLNLAYVPTAPTIAATMFDLVVSASSIMACNWESGAGAIAAENQALRWLADLAGYPADAGGVFVSGGSAANLSALVTARSVYRSRHSVEGQRLAFAITAEAHSSVRAAAHVMDAAIINVAGDERGAMTAKNLAAALDSAGPTVAAFAVVATGGTTNGGIVDDLDGIATVCTERGIWLHVDGAYGLAALVAPSVRSLFTGIERSDSFGVDPHKWLFAPYDCAALVYRDPQPAAIAHAQHGDYLEAIDRREWNPSDYAYHLSRRARGLPMWFSLATYGTAAYTNAIEVTLRTARGIADAIRTRAFLELILAPELSVVLFRRVGWTDAQYHAFSISRAKAGVALIVPTKWHGKTVLRICVINPRTTVADVAAVLDDLASDIRP